MLRTKPQTLANSPQQVILWALPGQAHGGTFPAGYILSAFKKNVFLIFLLLSSCIFYPLSLPPNKLVLTYLGVHILPNCLLLIPCHLSSSLQILLCIAGRSLHFPALFFPFASRSHSATEGTDMRLERELRKRNCFLQWQFGKNIRSQTGDYQH